MSRAALLASALLGLLLPQSACVTVDGERHPNLTRPVETDCVTSPPVATVDDLERNRVRLVFNQAPNCTETVYELEHTSVLSQSTRWAIAMAVAAAVIAPVVVWQASKADQTVSGVGTFAVYADLGLFCAVGAVMNLALSAARSSLPSSFVVVRDSKSMGPQARDGTVTWPGVPGPGRETMAGAMELSLGQSQGLELGELFLDGVRVELSSLDVERLSSLSSCREALRGFDAATWNKKSCATEPSRCERARECSDHGWGFADELLYSRSHP